MNTTPSSRIMILSSLYRTDIFTLNIILVQLETIVIVVPEMDIFNNYILDEIIVLEVDHRYEGQPVFNEYSSDDE
jgi:hypothetical protein